MLSNQLTLLNPTQTPPITIPRRDLDPHMEGSDPHMEGSGVSNPFLRDQSGCERSVWVLSLFPRRRSVASDEAWRRSSAWRKAGASCSAWRPVGRSRRFRDVERSGDGVVSGLFSSGRKGEGFDAFWAGRTWWDQSLYCFLSFVFLFGYKCERVQSSICRTIG